MTFRELIEQYHRAGYGALYVVSPEEWRVEREIQEACKARKAEFWRWSVTEGWLEVVNGDGGPERARRKETTDPLQALTELKSMPSGAIYVLRDFHFWIEDAVIIRRLRDLMPLLRATGRMIVFVSPRLILPVELEKEVSMIDFRLPGRADLDARLSSVTSAADGDVPFETERGQVVEAALGMTATEAEDAFALAIIRHKAMNADAVRTIQAEKAQVIKKTGLLEIIEPEDDLDSAVGGLDLLIAWLKSRQKAFGDRARQHGLPVPKGVLLLGVPGSGKSLCAKSVARQWNLPLLRLDIGRAMGSLVGESEANIRAALRMCADMAPCVTWIDEIEKGVAGMGSSGQTDSGVTARVVGTLLTWLQEKKAPSFMVATANRVQALPPELLRKGRFDELFWVDLPDEAERLKILEIHARKRGWDPEQFDLGLRKVSEVTPNFTGAELEQVIVEGLFRSFDEGCQPRQEDFLGAVEATVPLAVTMAEEIAAMREWAKTRARPASRSKPQEIVTGPRRRLEI